MGPQVDRRAEWIGPEWIGEYEWVGGYEWVGEMSELHRAVRSDS